MDTPPVGERIELRVVKPVNLRSDASAKSNQLALLAKEAILWQDGQQGDFFEVWVHGFVHKDFVKVVTGQ